MIVLFITRWDGVTARSVTARSINARRTKPRRISSVGQAVVVSVLGDQGCAGDVLEVHGYEQRRRVNTVERK